MQDEILMFSGSYVYLHTPIRQQRSATTTKNYTLGSGSTVHSSNYQYNQHTDMRRGFTWIRSSFRVLEEGLDGKEMAL